MPSGTAFRFYVLFLQISLIVCAYGFGLFERILEYDLIISIMLSIACVVFVWIVALLLTLVRAQLERRRVEGGSDFVESPSASGIVATLTDRLQVPALRSMVSQKDGRERAWVSMVGSAPVLFVGRLFEALSRLDPDVFKAIIVHEIAHVRNGDLFRISMGRSLLTVSLWAIGIFTVTTAFYKLSDQSAMVAAAELFVRYALAGLTSTLLICIVFFRLIRWRELNSDWYAASQGFGDPLLRVLKSQSTMVGASFLPRFFSVHPLVRSRIDSLELRSAGVIGDGVDYIIAGVFISFANQFFFDQGNLQSVVSEFDSWMFVGSDSLPLLGWLFGLASVLLIQYTTLPAIAVAIILFYQELIFHPIHENLLARFELTAGRAVLALVGMSLGALLWPANILKASFGLEEGSWNIWLAMFDPGFLEITVLLFLNFTLINWILRRIPLANTPRVNRRRAIVVIPLLFYLAGQVQSVGRLLFEGAVPETVILVSQVCAVVGVLVSTILWALFAKWRRNDLQSDGSGTH